MSSRPWPLESKAEAVRRALAINTEWHPRIARETAIKNWKSRKGNLNGRPHPSETLPWVGWWVISKKRYLKKRERNSNFIRSSKGAVMNISYETFSIG